MALFQYFQKNVVIQDCNGVIWHGFVTAYTPEIDAEDEDEIRSIKIVKGEDK